MRVSEVNLIVSLQKHILNIVTPYHLRHIYYPTTSIPINSFPPMITQISINATQELKY